MLKDHDVAIRRSQEAVSEGDGCTDDPTHGSRDPRRSDGVSHNDRRTDGSILWRRPLCLSRGVSADDPEPDGHDPNVDR